MRLLVRVLVYDDLLADVQEVHALGEGPLCLGRADAAAEEGRDAAGLRLFDGFLSGRHATLQPGPGGDVLRDEGSRNGTFVSGERVSERALQDGDLIEVGHTLLCYRTVEARAFAALQALQAAGGALLGPTRTLCAEAAAVSSDLRRIAASGESVLLLAETGCGKEVAAGLVHDGSGRRGPLCTVDCGAVPESLFESVFFGHRRGAFTGAAADQAGLIARADGGTLLLDEVANMSAASQAKLLRVVEDGRVTPLGAAQAQRVDVRFVAATNADLFAPESGFRADLLRRLGSYVAHLPPLRRRREDLGLLSAYFLREAGARAASISAAAGRRLYCGRFPGNIRQLRAALRSALQLSGGRIDLPHLPPPERPAAPAATGAAPEAPAASAATPAAASAAPTAEAVDAALRASRGNVVQAAARLGTHPRQLYRWIGRLGLDLASYRR